MTVAACPFPGIPLIESPVFVAELDRMALSPSERDLAVALHRDGYAVIDFPDLDLDDRFARMRADLAPQLGIADLDPESSKQVGVGRIQDAWQANPDVKAIADNADVIALLSRLYGRQAFPFQTLNFATGTQQQLHTDAVHFSSIPQRFMCGVWLAMEDVTADAGPLCYVPGSHKWPILDNTLIARRGTGQPLDSPQIPYHEAWDALAAEHPRPVEHFLARKGQALIWCANLLHGGSLQTDPRRTRWSQVTHYFFDECIYYTPALSDEYLGRLALRRLVSIVDGSPRPNLYLGEEILPPRAPPPEPSMRSILASLRKDIARVLRRRRAQRQNRPAT